MWMLLWMMLLAKDPVSITTRDHFTTAPATVRLLVRIEPDARNRFWCLEYVGGIASLSCYELEGERAAALYQRTLKDLPGGRYVAEARVCRDAACEDRVAARVEFEVRAHAREGGGF